MPGRTYAASGRHLPQRFRDSARSRLDSTQVRAVRRRLVRQEDVTMIDPDTDDDKQNDKAKELEKVQEDAAEEREENGGHQ